jgi:anhydro-N-acetylmuramic acid kinase
MIYRAIGLMSGSSLDGLDLAFAEFTEQAGQWTYELKETACYAYTPEWTDKLSKATRLSALDYQLLHTDYGHYLGEQVNRFIEEKSLHFQAALIASHGHTSFHIPAQKMTAQLGDGAAIAAETGLPVVSDLRAMDIALGGQGAPIVPVGEKLLFSGYEFFLNIGGIANISVNAANYLAFDICPANRVLNLLANQAGQAFDRDGALAAAGNINPVLLDTLNALPYYLQAAPKSLANDFGTDIVYPIIQQSGCDTADALRTYTEHIAVQVQQSLQHLSLQQPQRLLVTGGGALNQFLVDLLRAKLEPLSIQVVVPDEKLVNYKEALVMAFIGVLRWRQENNVFASVTGASRNSIGGALWIGQDA